MLNDYLEKASEAGRYDALTRAKHLNKKDFLSCYPSATEREYEYYSFMYNKVLRGENVK
jgi:hypothetical protein